MIFSKKYILFIILFLIDRIENTAEILTDLQSILQYFSDAAQSYMKVILNIMIRFNSILFHYINNRKIV